MTTRCEACGRPHDEEAKELVGRLRERHREILVLLAKGISNSQMAAMLHISQRTVEQHRYRLGVALGVTTPVEQAILAYRAGLLGECFP